jgi:hypothetical protein
LFQRVSVSFERVSFRKVFGTESCQSEKQAGFFQTNISAIKTEGMGLFGKGEA